MKIEEVKTGILVFISSLIEEEIDGIKRREGALGMVDSPVLGTGGLWWWVTHEDGTQIKYRYCEILEMKTVKLSNGDVFEGFNNPDGKPISDDMVRNTKSEPSSIKEKNNEDDAAQEWIYEVIEKWIN